MFAASSITPAVRQTNVRRFSGSTQEQVADRGDRSHPRHLGLLVDRLVHDLDVLRAQPAAGLEPRAKRDDAVGPGDGGAEHGARHAPGLGELLAHDVPEASSPAQGAADYLAQEGVVEGG
jgi:hypothetical protein